MFFNRLNLDQYISMNLHKMYMKIHETQIGADKKKHIIAKKMCSHTGTYCYVIRHLLSPSLPHLVCDIFRVKEYDIEISLITHFE